MAKKDGKREPAAPPTAPAATAGTCPVAWCPICLAVSVAQPVAPEVVTHLLKAGTEMFLALQSIIETRAEDLGGETPTEPVRLEKIDIG